MSFGSKSSFGDTLARIPALAARDGSHFAPGTLLLGKKRVPTALERAWAARVGRRGWFRVAREARIYLDPRRARAMPGDEYVTFVGQRFLARHLPPSIAGATSHVLVGGTLLPVVVALGNRLLEGWMYPSQLEATDAPAFAVGLGATPTAGSTDVVQPPGFITMIVRTYGDARTPPRSISQEVDQLAVRLRAPTITQERYRVHGWREGGTGGGTSTLGRTAPTWRETIIDLDVVRDATRSDALAEVKAILRSLGVAADVRLAPATPAPVAAPSTALVQVQSAAAAVPWGKLLLAVAAVATVAVVASGSGRVRNPPKRRRKRKKGKR